MPEIPLGGGYFINVGGALIPLGLCAYLLVRCQSWQERLSALIAAAADVGGVCYVIDDQTVGKTGGTNSIVAGLVYDVENAVKVRTGEEGYDALQDVE